MVFNIGVIFREKAKSSLTQKCKGAVSHTAEMDLDIVKGRNRTL